MKLKGFRNCPMERGEDPGVQMQGTDRRSGFVDGELNFGKNLKTPSKPLADNLLSDGFQSHNSKCVLSGRSCQVLPCYLI